MEPFIASAPPRALAPYSHEEAESALLRLERLQGHLLGAAREVRHLLNREAQGRGHIAGLNVSKEVALARDAIREALVRCASAQTDIERMRSEFREKHSERWYQLSACRLAVSYFDDPSDRRARDVARGIMRAADISEPEKSKFSYLLKEARAAN
ncbi:MAG: hypothetical protein NXI15_05610 [Gammaproteobacteria bacterium]|nr:hypothetical protein [Gammaproteobacteria bacterium]